MSYVDNGGLFEPIGDIKDMSGIFHSEGNWVYNEDGENKFMIKNLKTKAEHIWLMHREYIIGGVIGFVLGAIIF